MNQLAVTNGKRIAPHQAQANPLDGLPRWLAYLVSAYPQTKISDHVLMVMEDQFGDFDDVLLFEAAREFVRSDRRNWKGFPTAPEFREVAERLQARREEREQERLIAEWQERVKLHNRLRGQRTVILRAWYRGRVGDRVLLAMANKLDAAGLECAAASLRSKLS